MVRMMAEAEGGRGLLIGKIGMMDDGMKVMMKAVMKVMMKVVIRLND